MPSSSLLAAVLAAQPVVVPAGPATPVDSAQAGGASGVTEQGDHHADERNAIVVTGVRRNREDVLGGVTVLSSETLAREVRSTIGETLASQPGVSATSFGPNASRPIIRGLGGDRIRVLTDGIGSLDVSTTSADHAVAINPLTAERIEVLRGPAALLYGSNAVGGVVNVIDSRIPRNEPERPLHVDAVGTLGSAADERAINLTADIPLVGKLVLHGDGSWTRTDDLAIGGHVLSRALRDQARASAEPDIRALADFKDSLPNSAAEQSELAGGLAWVDGALNIGFAVSRLDNRYGVPVRYSLDPAIEAEKVEIDLKQTRYDARAEIPLAGPIEQLRLRAGAIDYRHDEIEETGEIGSSFFSKGAEGRIEAVQRTVNGWGGAFGAQFLDRKVRIRGEEKFLPDNRQRQAGLFTLQHLETGPWRVEAGARVEFNRLTAREDEDLDTPALKRSFTSVSGSLGGTYAVADGLRAGLNLSYTQRAPSPDELFANGPHKGTQAFEIGDPTFGQERSIGLEATLRRTAGPLTFAASLYHTRFADFIYLAPTEATADDLPVYRYRSGPARFTGFELETRAPLGQVAGAEWSIEALADYVRARVRGFGPAPQIPPLRLLGAVEGRRGNVNGRLEVEHSFAQRRNAPIETETDGFTLVNASLNWRPLVGKPELTLGLSANNLFDVNARRHTSLLKDYAPLPGRDFRLTARFSY
jgi:iron complex outermembrane receptor protein